MTNIALPSFIVVDERDGYIFSRDGSGNLYTLATASAMARERNQDVIEAGLPYPGGTYKVYRVTPDLNGHAGKS